MKISYKFIISTVIAFFIMHTSLFSQVQLRDSTIIWQHHAFQLNEDYSMNNYSSADNYRQQVHLTAKVIENELIRLTIIPEYGARIIFRDMSSCIFAKRDCVT